MPLSVAVGTAEPYAGAIIGPVGEPRSIGQIFTDLAEEDPGFPSVTCEGATASRLDLERRANRLARAYAELGVNAATS